MSDSWATSPLPLYTLGGRPYVNGLTLLEEAVAGFAATTGLTPTSVLRFQATRFVRSHAQLALAPMQAARGSKRARKAAARIDIDTDQGAYVVLVEPDATRPVDVDRAEYARAAYVPEIATPPDGGLVAKLAHIDGMVDLLRACVETMHRVETAQTRADGNPGRVSWAWLKRLPWLAPETAALVSSIRYDAPRFLPGRGVRFVLRDLHLTPAHPPAEVAMFAPLPGQADPALGDR